MPEADVNLRTTWSENIEIEGIFEYSIVDGKATIMGVKADQANANNAAIKVPATVQYNGQEYPIVRI